MSPILPGRAPGATIGILGGGQLARMTALAARSMGYGVAVLDPDPACAAAPVADEVITAPFDDADAAARLARRSAVVTFDIEKVAPEASQAAALHAPVRPGPELLALVQDRLAQKRWLASHHFPVGPFAGAEGEPEARRAVEALGPARLKARTGGYDGRGQLRVGTPAEAEAAARRLGPSLVEAELPLAAELSVLVARSPAGEVVVHPPARNWARDGVLDLSVLPAPLPEAVVRDARAIAADLAVALGLEGILVAELFLTTRGELLVNELAPRPHNTYHHADAACATGQFEQLVRAACGLPLGAGALVRPAALANLLGGPWVEEGRIAAALQVPGTRIHLYGKQARPGRKLGHLVATGATPDEAVARVRLAREALEGTSGQVHAAF